MPLLQIPEQEKMLRTQNDFEHRVRDVPSLDLPRFLGSYRWANTGNIPPCSASSNSTPTGCKGLGNKWEAG
jgi:hypothetical protein